MSHSFVRGLVRWVVVALLLGQLAVASYACPALRAIPADAGQRSAVDVACEMEAEDALVLADSGAPIDTLDADSPNLCAEHCKYGQQSDQTSSVNVPVAVPLAPFENNPPRLVESRLRPTATAVSALVSACPPHAILHCVRRS
jgi:hypothetical protein